MCDALSAWLGLQLSRHRECQAGSGSLTHRCLPLGMSTQKPVCSRILVGIEGKGQSSDSTVGIEPPFRQGTAAMKGGMAHLGTLG